MVKTCTSNPTMYFLSHRGREKSEAANPELKFDRPINLVSSFRRGAIRGRANFPPGLRKIVAEDGAPGVGARERVEAAIGRASGVDPVGSLPVSFRRRCRGTRENDDGTTQTGSDDPRKRKLIEPHVHARN